MHSAKAWIGSYIRAMTATITPEQVAHVARLARLRFSDTELAGFTEQFNQIVDYIEQLKQVDVNDVPPMEFVHGTTNVLRDDEPGPLLTPAEALQNAPGRTEGFFSVPKVLE